MVRGGRGRVSVFALAALGIVERRPRPPGDRRADGPRAADGLAAARRRFAEQVSPQDVPLGAAFLVKPGERIPLDGRVVDGASDVNQAPITGESVPVPKSRGDEVFAGTINGDGALRIESTRAASDTTLARIIRMVGEAQSRAGRRSNGSRSSPAFTRRPSCCSRWPSSSCRRSCSAASGATWFYRALVLLVIACPCALVISTPVSIVAGIASAARQGVLVKGGAFLEAPAHLRAIAFDKTGTLTAGRPRVVEVVPLSGHDERELIERAAAMEQHSEHPIARAVLDYAETHHFVPAPADDFQVLQGKGARATFNGREFWLGSHRYLEAARPGNARHPRSGSKPWRAKGARSSSSAMRRMSAA